MDACVERFSTAGDLEIARMFPTTARRQFG